MQLAEGELDLANPWNTDVFQNAQGFVSPDSAVFNTFVKKMPGHAYCTGCKTRRGLLDFVQSCATLLAEATAYTTAATGPTVQSRPEVEDQL